MYWQRREAITEGRGNPAFFLGRGKLIWFVSGAGLGVLQMAVSWLRRPTTMEHPFQGFAAAAVLGALIYGTILWMLANFVFD